jgi:hypothetical protein
MFHYRTKHAGISVDLASRLRPSLTKRAFLSGVLRRFGDLAHKNPARALTYTHAIDQGLRGALYGGLIGGAGGMLLAHPGEEENMALRGALLGALSGGVYGGFTGRQDAKKLLSTREGINALAGRLSALHSAGRPLSYAFTS